MKLQLKKHLRRVRDENGAMELRSSAEKRLSNIFSSHRHSHDISSTKFNQQDIINVLNFDFNTPVPIQSETLPPPPTPPHRNLERKKYNIDGFGKQLSASTDNLLSKKHTGNSPKFELPIEIIILSQIDYFAEPKDIRTDTSNTTIFDHISNKKKRKFISEIIKEGETPIDEEEENDLEYFRENNPILKDFMNLDSAFKLCLPQDKILYPTIYGISTRLDNFKLSLKVITNVTQKNKYDYLFDNVVNSEKSHSSNLPYQLNKVVTMESLSESSKFKNLSSKAKRFSQRIDQKLGDKFDPRQISNHKNNIFSRSSELITEDAMSINGESHTSDLNQNFIKYHILSFQSRRLLITTNPSRQHIYCKYSPGYYVDIQRPNISTEEKAFIKNNGGKNSDIGFRLVFRCNDDDPDADPRIVVTKKSKPKGGNYVLWLDNTLLGNNNVENAKKVDYWNREVSLVDFFDIYPTQELKNTVYKSDSHHVMNRYEFKDLNDLQWLIGSIPKIKSSNFSKFKSYTSNVFSEDRTSAKTEGVKVTHKSDVYFFTNNVKSIGGISVKLPDIQSNSGNNHRNYHQSSPHSNINGILAAFRPHEVLLKKKIVKEVKRFKNRTSEKSYLTNHTSSTVSSFKSVSENTLSTTISRDESSTSDQTSVHTESTSTNFDTISSASSSAEDYGKRNVFFHTGDGVVLKNPADDMPNDTKMGWVTIYDSEPYIKNTLGMKEIVLALTVAVGFERVFNEDHESEVVM